MRIISIDVARLERLVKDRGDARQLLFFQVAPSFTARRRRPRSLSCSPSSTARTSIAYPGDRHDQATAANEPRAPYDLWIRATEPEN